MQRVLKKPNLENNMTQEHLTRRIKQLEEQQLFDKSTGAGGASSGIDGTSPVVDEAFVRVWRGEIGKEFCRMADAQRKYMVGTMSCDEMVWTDEQARQSPKVPP